MKKLITLMATMLLMMCLTACGGAPAQEGEMKSTEEDVKLTFEASFYRNNGELWLIAEGSYFNITPNKTVWYNYITFSFCVCLFFHMPNPPNLFLYF